MSSENSSPVFLDTSVQYLKGIGPKKAKVLEKNGFESLKDLFFLFPRRYEDRTRFKSIQEIKEGEVATVRGRVVQSQVRYFKGRGHCQIVLKDASGTARSTWFNQSYLARSFRKDDEMILYGKVSRFGTLQFHNPEYEKVESGDDPLIHSGRITPIYPLASGLVQRSLRHSLWFLIENHKQEIGEYLPDSLLKKHQFLDLQTALEMIHFPRDRDSYLKAKHRLIFDDFFMFELSLIRRLSRYQTEHEAYPISDSEDRMNQFIAKLPFSLTNSQKMVLGEFQKELEKPSPMTRLLQGDVGSGKTVIAAALFFACAQSGHQGVFMAPTETLAEQHFLSLNQLLGEWMGDSVALLTGSLSEQEKASIKKRMESGSLSLVIGTHALLQEDVIWKKLALVVIDEQHKFGVKQRAKLLQQEIRPHVLLMTATPIPRSLAMTLYGDLHLTTLKELPAGRKPIQTHWFVKKDEGKAFGALKERLQKGEQGYFIYPAIQESETERLSCEEDFERIQKLFPGTRLEILHGRTPANQRGEIMNRFKRGEIQILISTTVIEVGIDNPRATFMVVQGAEYFGLSQLHQIRGRIGRGDQPSVCYLISEARGEGSRERLETLTKSQDGFYISEQDLKLRGPGDFLGTRQSGIPLFKIANLVTDQAMLEMARDEARHILEKDLNLELPEHQLLRKELESYESKFID